MTESNYESINFYSLLDIAINRIGMSSSDFWAMPFFMFVSLLEIKKTDQERKQNRKFVVDSMRYTRQKFGWV